jgi:hypothetical protein
VAVLARLGSGWQINVNSRFSYRCWRRVVLASLLWQPVWALAQADTPSEYQVKAAYLFNFAKFIEWPAHAFAGKDALFVLCIAGRDPFGAALAPFEHKPVQSRELRVRRGVAADDLRGCHILFVPYSEERRLTRFVRAAEGLPVVTVSEIDGFAEAGGVIGLVEADRRIQFEINLASAQLGGMRISSQLLRLARAVREVRP